MGRRPALGHRGVLVHNLHDLAVPALTFVWVPPWGGRAWGAVLGSESGRRRVSGAS